MKKNRFIWLIIIVFINKTTTLYAMGRFFYKIPNVNSNANNEERSQRSIETRNDERPSSIEILKSYVPFLNRRNLSLPRIGRIGLDEIEDEEYAPVSSGSCVGSSDISLSYPEPSSPGIMLIDESSNGMMASFLEEFPKTKPLETEDVDCNSNMNISVEESHISGKKNLDKPGLKRSKSYSPPPLRDWYSKESPYKPDSPSSSRMELFESSLPFKGDTQLHEAAKKNDLTLLDTMEITEDLIRTKNKNGETAFHCAARVGAKEFIEHLRKKQILAHEKYENSCSAHILSLAMLTQDLIKLIIGYAFDRIEELTTVLAMQDNFGCIPIMLALNNNYLRTARLLIPRYEDLYIKNKSGQTVRDLVARTCFEKIKALLKPGEIHKLHQEYLNSNTLSKKINLYITENEELHLRAAELQLKLEKLKEFSLLKEFELHDRNHRFSDDPLFLSIKDGRLDYIKKFIEVYRAHIDCQDENGDSPLHHAMRYAQFEIANYLDDTLHADLTKKNNKGECAINVHQHSTGETMLHTMVQRENLEMASKLLTDYKANPNLTDNNGWSPLHVAAYYNYVKHAALLIKHAASLYAQDKEGRTPLHIAIAKKHEKTALFLIKKMIDFSIKNVFDVLVLHAAIDTEQEKVARQIVYKEKYSPYAKGTSYNQKLSKLLAGTLKALLNPAYESNVSMERDALINLIQEYTTSHPSILLKNDANQTALHRAAQWSSLDKADQMCTFLIHNGAKPEEHDAFGHTYTKYLQDERIKQ